jgi:copper ion binding protein
METKTMRIDGMSCGHCVRAVRDALGEVPGVQVQRVDVGSVTVAYDPAVARPEQIADAVRDAGYDVAEA